MPANKTDDRLTGGAEMDGTAGKGRLAPGGIGPSQRFQLTHASLSLIAGAITSWEVVLWDPKENEQIAVLKSGTTAGAKFTKDELLTVPVNDDGDSMELRCTTVGATDTVRFLADGRIVSWV